MRKHNSKSKAVAELVRAWLPVTLIHPNGLAALLEGRQGWDVAPTPLRLTWPRAAPYFRSFCAPTLTNHGIRFLASFGSLRCRFYSGSYVRVKIQTENFSTLTPKIQNVNLKSTSKRSRSFKDLLSTGVCY